MEHKNVERVEIAPLFNLYSRRHKGHTVSTAIKDVIDNHVDSGCAKENIKTNTIQVFIAEDKFRKGKKVLITTDFGFGMFSNKIQEMYRDGYSTKGHGEDNYFNKLGYLGKYGNGQKNATAFLSNGVLTLSCVQDDKIHAVDYNLKELDIRGSKPEVCKYVLISGEDKKTDTYLEYWMDYMKDEYGEIALHGTMNIFYDLHDDVVANLEAHCEFSNQFDQNSLGCILGETYCKKLNDNLKIYIGKTYKSLKQVKPMNPFFGGKIKEEKTFQIPTKVNGETHLFPVEVKFHVFDKENIAHRKTSAKSSGFYFFRESRLHLDAHDNPMKPKLSPKALHKLEKDSSLKRVKGRERSSTNEIWPETAGVRGRVRVEINFLSMLDDEFQVDANKTNIHFSNSESIADLAIYLYKTSHKIINELTLEQKDENNTLQLNPFRFKNEIIRKSRINPQFFLNAANDTLKNYKGIEVNIVKQALKTYNSTIGVEIHL